MAMAGCNSSSGSSNADSSTCLLYTSTSHYTPEDLKDADTKIAYLENLKAIAADYGSAEEFKAAVQKQYPNYSGENYLDMTAGFFFS